LVAPATSYHRGGIVNVAMCDGSVTNFADSVDADVWYQLGTRDGGEVRDVE
jgi:prepilin-type processing-associated H-X9-DG protein